MEQELHAASLPGNFVSVRGNVRYPDRGVAEMIVKLLRRMDQVIVGIAEFHFTGGDVNDRTDFDDVSS
jgi:hypothetical protein